MRKIADGAIRRDVRGARVPLSKVSTSCRPSQTVETVAGLETRPTVETVETVAGLETRPTVETVETVAGLETRPTGKRCSTAGN